MESELESLCLYSVRVQKEAGAALEYRRRSPPLGYRVPGHCVSWLDCGISCHVSWLDCSVRCCVSWLDCLPASMCPGGL